MLMFVACILAALGVAWWVFPLGFSLFSTPLMLAAVLLWALAMQKVAGTREWKSRLAILPAGAAFVLMTVPAIVMAPAVHWAIFSRQRGVAEQALVSAGVRLIVAMLLGAAAGGLQALALRWRTGSPPRSTASIVLSTAGFAPAVVAFIWVISRFWPLID